MATSYKIRGIEPPDLARYGADIRTQFWGWVVELGLRAKGREILAGLDKDGNPLKPISDETKKHRRSAMTPSGKGDPSAPPLIPGWQKSRTYSLLAGRALSTHAEFYWRFDSFTGDSWGKILAYQAAQGRDVIGLSPSGLAYVKVYAWDRWRKWKEAGPREIAIANAAAARSEAAAPTPARKPRRQLGESKTMHEGRVPTIAATYGINAAGRKGHGGRTPAEWAAYMRQRAQAAPPGRPARPAAKSPISGSGYNRAIRHAWPAS